MSVVQYLRSSPKKDPILVPLDIRCRNIIQSNGAHNLENNPIGEGYFVQDLMLEVGFKVSVRRYGFGVSRICFGLIRTWNMRLVTTSVTPDEMPGTKSRGTLSHSLISGSILQQEHGEQEPVAVALLESGIN